VLFHYFLVQILHHQASSTSLSCFVLIICTLELYKSVHYDLPKIQFL